MYRTHDVPVRGGTLRVGEWQADGGNGPDDTVVLAVHGITSSHLAWPVVAEHLPPGTRLLAPDLRGRGRSAHLPAPYGFATHVADCVAVLDTLTDGRCDVVAGHSMGGFVAVALAAAEPARVGSLLLVDGGIPLVLPDGVTLLDALSGALGPAAARLERTFADRDAYRAYWRAHPAFAGAFTPAVEAYVDYDLDPDGPPWRSSCRADAMRADFAEQFVGGPVDRAWPAVDVRIEFLRAPLGLQAEPPGLYPEHRVAEWAEGRAGFAWRTVEDVNHYTISLGATGAAAVVAALDDLIR